MIQENYSNQLMEAVDKIYGSKREYCNALVNGEDAKLYQRADKTVRMIGTRKRIERQLAELSTGDLAVVDIFSDMSWSPCAYLTGIRGPVKAYKVRVVEDDWACPYFGLYFEGSADWIIGQKEKLKNRNYLFELFIRVNVKIQTVINKKDVEDAIREKFMGMIYLTRDEVTISALAGWNTDNFQSSGNYPIGIQEDIKNFPVMRKNFAMLDMQDSTAGEYFAEMRRIKDPKDRLMIMALPFAGLLSTLLGKAGKPLNFGVNFIMQSDFSKKKICEWLQIYNRNVLLPVSADMSEKEFATFMRSIKDEILVLDASCYDEDGRYWKKKKDGKLAKAFRLIFGEERLKERTTEPLYAGIATITNEFIGKKQVYNIFISEEFYESAGKEFESGKVMERVFSSFVRYVKKNFDDIQETIRCDRNFADEKSRVLAVVVDILIRFWRDKKIGFMKSAGVEGIDLANFFADNTYDEDELVEQFISGFRKEARKMNFAPKCSESLQSKNQIFYDTDSLWIPSSNFRAILSQIALKGKERQILLELKNLEALKTDNGTYTKKITVQGKRIPVYQIQRNLFNQNGLTEIVVLGGNGDAV